MDYIFMLSLKHIQLDDLVKIMNEHLKLDDVDDQPKRYNLITDFFTDSLCNMKLSKAKKSKLFDFSKSRYKSFSDMRDRLVAHYDRIHGDISLNDIENFISDDEPN
jgi:hypothetical protein